jgi:hypothetical protein
MHQTSSRLLRMTSDERPFTRVSLVERERVSRRDPCRDESTRDET